ncbi:MAG TPA: hypothetical protein VK659_29625 [Asanoa sp.]|nr:hypothetical protein [Asanoa sp.]
MIPDQEPETDIIVSAAEPLDVPGATLGQDPAAPIFVDETGRRRRLVRFAAYGIGAICLSYTALVGVSIAGGPALPHALMPFPDSVQRPDRDATAENALHTAFRPPNPGPFVAPLPPPTAPGGPGALSTSTLTGAARPTPSPTKGTAPVSPPPVTTEPTRPPEATSTLPPDPTTPPTEDPTEPPPGDQQGGGGGGEPADSPASNDDGTGTGGAGGGTGGGESGGTRDGGGTGGGTESGGGGDSTGDTGSGSGSTPDAPSAPEATSVATATAEPSPTDSAA